MHHINHPFSLRPTHCALLVWAACSAGSSMAAERLNLEQLAAPGFAASAATIHQRTGLSANELRPLRSRSYANGNSATRFEQSYLGVPIWGEAIVERRAAGKGASALVGVMLKDLHKDLSTVVPLLDEKAVLQKAKTLTHAQKSHNEQVRLFIKADQGAKARLVYLVSLVNDSATSPQHPFMLIDANGGELLAHWDGMQHVAGEGPGGNSRTGYYFYQTGGTWGALDVTQSGTTCLMSNASVKTINMKGLTTGSTVYSFPCFRNGAPGTTAQAPINDAHAFGTMSIKMYHDWLNLPALSQQLTIRFNYGASYSNLFFDGTSLIIGSAASAYILPDVIGHEISHGFTQQNSGLVYSGQSGGMNEAFSDMAGEAVEFYRSGSNDFLVGGNSPGGALRYMCNPTQDGRSIDNAKNYTSTMDVHYSSGVYNKAFCTLAKTTGWGTRKAFEVMASANDLYWTASSTFNNGACGVEKAATDRGYKTADVTAAFAAVGVSCTVTPPPTATPLGNGVPVSITLAAGANKLFAITVPAGKTQLAIKLSGGTGDADLYVRATTAPTTTSYTWRAIAVGNSESIVIATPAAATYYILVNGYAATSNASLVATY